MNQTLKKIELKGRLAHEFGAEYNFAVKSPAEAIRALCSQIEGFEDGLREGEYRVTRLYDNTETAIDENEIALSFGNASGVRIEPVIGGNKQGVGKLILGVVLIGAAFFTAGIPLAGFPGAGLAGTTVAGVSTAKIATIGALMALQGASMMLTPTPQAPQNAEQKESFMLDATGNLVEQGNAVPVVYGRCFVGSQVISAGITADEI